MYIVHVHVRMYICTSVRTCMALISATDTYVHTYIYPNLWNCMNSKCLSEEKESSTAVLEHSSDTDGLESVTSLT